MKKDELDALTSIIQAINNHAIKAWASSIDNMNRSMIEAQIVKDLSIGYLNIVQSGKMQERFDERG